ncbi:IQ domain-containing protein M-like isoform X8 [Rattus norvegicus]
MDDIESVSKRMEKEKEMNLRKYRMSEPFHSQIGLSLHNATSHLGLLKELETLEEERDTTYQERAEASKQKALYHGPNLKAVIKMYRSLIHRVRHRLGLWRTRQIIYFGELEEWMDRKKFYETMFAKREDWQGLERSELLKYFNDCGHFPTQKQIDELWDLFHRYSEGKYSEVIRKSSAIELLFTLYPPQGARVNAGTRLRSTWLRPLVDGEEGYKYIAPFLPSLSVLEASKGVVRLPHLMNQYQEKTGKKNVLTVLD